MQLHNSVSNSCKGTKGENHSLRSPTMCWLMGRKERAKLLFIVLEVQEEKGERCTSWSKIDTSPGPQQLEFTEIQSNCSSGNDSPLLSSTHLSSKKERFAGNRNKRKVTSSCTSRCHEAWDKQHQGLRTGIQQKTWQPLKRNLRQRTHVPRLVVALWSSTDTSVKVQLAFPGYLALNCPWKWENIPWKMYLCSLHTYFKMWVIDSNAI